MNPQIDFSQLPLRDIHLPGPVPWWPPAPGWWIVAALVLAGLVVLGLRYYADRRRRAAQKLLRGIAAALDNGAEPVQCLQQVSLLLRRFAITAAQSHAAPPTDVAGLIGERWLAYLDSSWERDAFRQGPGRLLLAGPYGRPDSVMPAAVGAVVQLAAEWLRRQPRAPVWPTRSRRPNPAPSRALERG